MSHSASPVTFEASYQPGSARFGRMFPTSLPVADWKDTELILLGLQMIESPTQQNADNTEIPAAYTYFGQFVDHDLTLDLVSSFERKVDPLCLRNFRTAALELDSVYGTGPHGAAYLYERDDTGRLRLGTVMDPLPSLDSLPDLEFDVPRWADNVPVMADTRNDENLFVNQLQVALIRFHNRIYDTLRASSHPDAFAEAQRQVRLHYQHIVLKDYLPKVVGCAFVKEIITNGRYLYDPSKSALEAFMPIEFSAAAFRFGHAMVRNKYQINRYPSDGTEKTEVSKPTFIPIMTENSRWPPFDCGKQGSRDSLIGGPVRQRDVVDWSFMLGDGQKARGFRPLLSDPLKLLPKAVMRDSHDIFTLASRNLLRGNALKLVEGRAAAGYAESVLGKQEPGFVLTDKEIWPDKLARYRGHCVPLWYYLLREAELRGKGLTLGPLGGRIVAETIIGVLQKDPESILNANEKFEPIRDFLIGGRFDLSALLYAAGFKIKP